METRASKALLVLPVAAVCVLTACGDSSEPKPEPRVPAAVAERLAGLSDETADAIAAGDECAAQESLDQLEAEAAEAKIPESVRVELEAGIDQLADGVECVPEPVVTEPPPEEEGGHGEDSCPPGLEKKDEKQGKGNEGQPCEERGGEGNGEGGDGDGEEGGD